MLAICQRLASDASEPAAAADGDEFEAGYVFVRVPVKLSRSNDTTTDKPEEDYGSSVMPWKVGNNEIGPPATTFSCVSPSKQNRG